ncbi:hypothetical protein DVH24_036323 [Malus domestica]|uniref:Uncharacterized protein n=1 Tax=Malus domestica TaxID=3750 RepID=A0A498IJ22_MALDO|nr:hypothetical protein DVH24_036323 [Malus domestica]
MEGTGRRSRFSLLLLPLLISLSIPCISAAYKPGDIVFMSKMGLYHSVRTLSKSFIQFRLNFNGFCSNFNGFCAISWFQMKTEWHDMIGRHCPIFAVNREVLVPIAKPMGYTGADAYKISFQVGREKFLIPWLFVINRKSSEVPMIDVHLRYSGSDLHGVTAKVVDMPHHYLEIHPDIRKQFWDAQHWPKHVLVRYTWEEQSEIDVTSGFYVLFGSGLMLSFILSIYILQSSRDKLARFVRERVAESNMPAGGVAKVE